MTKGHKRLLVVGRVAGGTSCAARARRLDERAEIIVFDRGLHVSFANCGLPYYVGNVIREEKKLLVATPELFRTRFNIDVRIEHKVIGIHRDAQHVSGSRAGDRTRLRRVLRRSGSLAWRRTDSAVVARY